jgi:hypothetical protein
MAPTKAMMNVHEKMVALGFDLDNEEVDVPFEYEDKIFVVKDFDGQKIFTEFKEPKKKSGKGKKVVVVESDLEEEAYTSDNMDTTSEPEETEPKPKTKSKKAPKNAVSDDGSEPEETEPKPKTKSKKAPKNAVSDDGSEPEETEPKPKTKSKKSKKDAIDKPKVKREPTAYNLFIREKMNELIQTHNEITGRQRFSLAVKMWNAQPDVIAKKAEKEKAVAEKKAAPKAPKPSKAIEAAVSNAVEV